jgi:hypothetical protein
MPLKHTKDNTYWAPPIRHLADESLSRWVKTFDDDNGQVVFEKCPPLGFRPVELIRVRPMDCSYYDVPSEFLWNAQERFEALGSLGGPRTCFQDDFRQLILRSARLVYILYGALKTNFPKKRFARENDDLSASVLQLLPYIEDDLFIPLMKYQLSYLFAKGEEQEEMPERPSWLRLKDGQILAGQLGRVFAYKCLGKKRSALIWRNTVLHGIKKGLDQMSAGSIAKNLPAVRSRLTRSTRTPKSLLEIIKKTAKEIFPKPLTVSDWNDINLWSQVSTNACYENPRSGLGAVGALWQNFYSTLKDVDGELQSWDSEASMCLGFCRLLTMSYLPVSDQLQAWYAPAWVPGDELAEARCVSWSIQQARAKIKAILEPLKVRLISAGDYNSNALWQGLQVKLWSALQRFPQFRLTGKSVELEDVLSIDSDWPFWISGDYNAATDNMNSDATEAVISVVAGDLETEFVLRRGLMGNEISFQSIADDYGIAVPDDFEMSNGQLMGCVFSFPILCIVNAACYRAAFCDLYNRLDCPCLVNGDDILFKADDWHYRRWCYVISTVGFNRSIGKNYKSRSMGVVNSTYFHLPRFDHRRSGIIPYWNCGWMTGVKKGGQEEEILDGAMPGIGAQQESLEGQFGGLSGSYRENLMTFKRFTRDFRFLEVKRSHMPRDFGFLGLRLSFESDDLSDRYREYFRRYGPRAQVPGTSLCPKTMATWKIQSVQTRVSQREMKSFWFEFKTTKWYRRWVGDEQIDAIMTMEKEIQTGLSDLESVWTSFGKL